ncbi:MAG: hypothetical protein NW208_09195 [Bryobacter sp.]|nr:hypothetical protein [Bryobacter sp.]
MTRLLCFFLLPLFAFAHAISVSTGEGKLAGKELRLTFRIPPYEAEHLLGKAQSAGDIVGQAISFPGAQRQSSTCKAGAEELTCELRYIYAEVPGEDIAAEVTLARATVPNHVAIVRLRRGNLERQSIFDRTFERDTLRFRAPTTWETLSPGLLLGAAQLRFQPILLLLLFTLAAVAGRRAWPYFLAAAAAFLLVLPDRFYITPGFFELATSLGIAYLALDQLLFPTAKGKGIGLGLIGALEGAGLAILARPAGPAALGFGGGNLLVQAGVCALAVGIWKFWPARWQKGTFGVLAALGIIESLWLFFVRF